MKIKILGRNPFLFISSVFSLLIFSCSTPKNITYFKDIPDTTRFKSIALANYVTPVILPDDVLQVTVQTLDPGASAMLNMQAPAAAAPTATSIVPGSAGSTPTGSTNGYLVDKDGYVVLPLLGKISVKGKTTNQVRDDIQVKAAEYYKDPVVNVRFANFKITVLGEVTRPATYVMPSEKVTLLDALGTAGDLTIYGKRENVLLIRDNEKGGKDFVRFDLNNSQLFTSPYFYLHQGDVVYVEPNKTKISSTDVAQVRRISILASVLSLLVVVGSRVKF